jgi:gluconate 2-dehydrogenase gamma chain
MSRLSRRDVVTATGAAAAAALGSAPPEAQAQQPRAAQPTTYLFFNADEVAFVEAAIARLIPADEQWPGALEAGVANFIDKELNGAWGAGERLYRSGPWQPGTASQGYQLPFTPAELFRTALAAITKDLARAGTPFAKMTAEQQDAYLRNLEAGTQDLGGVPSGIFFAHLWDATVEGFFSDPVYGGNRDMAAWKMIGFPGAYASYYDLVDQHGLRLDRPPTSLAEDSHGHVHVNPNVPAGQR